MKFLPIVDGDRTIGDDLVLNIDEALRPVIFHETGTIANASSSSMILPTEIPWEFPIPAVYAPEQ